MHLFNLVLLIYTCFYFVTAGQAIFYKLCFGKVFENIPASGFLLIRKMAEPILDLKLKIVYIGGLVSGIILCLLSINGLLLYQFASMVSFVLFVTDVVLAKKYSMPLNEKIRAASVNDEINGTVLQKEWIRWILVRGNLSLIGFGLMMFVVITS